MKVISFNIESGFGVTKGYWQYPLAYLKNIVPTNQKFIHAIGQYLASENADFIFLNEVDAGSLRSNFENQLDIINSYVKGFSAFFPAAKSWRYHQGNAIISRFPIISQLLISLPGKGEQRTLGKIEININGVNTECYVTHLSLDHKSQKLQIQAIASALTIKDCPKIIAGDFNTDQPDDFKPFYENGYVKSPSIPTFPSWKPKRSLDHIMWSKHFDSGIVKAHTSIRLSDHSPFVAKINVPKNI